MTTLNNILRFYKGAIPESLKSEYDSLQDLEKSIRDEYDRLPENIMEWDEASRAKVLTMNATYEEKSHVFADALALQGIKMRPNLPQSTGQNQFDVELPTSPATSSVKNFGQEVMANQDFASWCFQAKNRSTPGANSPMVMLDIDTKSLITGASSTSAGAFITTDRRAPTEMGLFYRPLSFLDMVPFFDTTSDLIDYVEESAFDNQATGVSEATGYSDGLKPISSMSFTVKARPVETIPHLMAVTRNALADVPRMASMINGALVYGVRETLETYCISGTGTAPELLGIYNVPGTLTQSFDTDLFITYRKAITAVQRPGNDPTAPGGNVEPDVFIMHPSDWEAIELTYDNNQRYYYGGPMAMGEKMLWGRRVVTSFAAVEGSPVLTTTRFLEGYVRSGISIRATESHSDWFRRNIVAVLAEGRFSFVVRRPSATCVISLS